MILSQPRSWSISLRANNKAVRRHRVQVFAFMLVRALCYVITIFTGRLSLRWTKKEQLYRSESHRPDLLTTCSTIMYHLLLHRSNAQLWATQGCCTVSSWGPLSEQATLPTIYTLYAETEGSAMRSERAHGPHHYYCHKRPRGKLST